ncbi:MAG: AEC family transporter [Clostridia bacterium]|nr:AEC family transporter [Clostridia bacterium]
MFLKNVGIAAEQVAILYLMAVIGAICEKTGIFTESTAKKCTDLLFYVVTTAKILESFISLEYSKQTAKNLFIAIGCGLAMHAVASLGVAPLFNRSEPKKASVYKFAAMFGNCGYMGLPLVDAVVGREGVFYCSAVIISFQIFNFTYGVRLMTIGEGDGKSKIDFKKLILNPGVLPVFAGLPVFLLSLKLPGLITVPVTSLASMNSPLAMLIFGTFIANTDFKSVFKQWRMLCVALFKLVLMPACMMAAVKLIGLTGPLALTLIVASATPPANNTIMFSAKYDRDTGLASQMVAVISFLSILTLPVVIALSKVWIV